MSQTIDPVRIKALLHQIIQGSEICQDDNFYDQDYLRLQFDDFKRTLVDNFSNIKDLSSLDNVLFYMEDPDLDAGLLLCYDQLAFYQNSGLHGFLDIFDLSLKFDAQQLVINQLPLSFSLEDEAIELLYQVLSDVCTILKGQTPKYFKDLFTSDDFKFISSLKSIPHASLSLYLSQAGAQAHHSVAESTDQELLDQDDPNEDAVDQDLDEDDFASEESDYRFGESKVEYDEIVPETLSSNDTGLSSMQEIQTKKSFDAVYDYFASEQESEEELSEIEINAEFEQAILMLQNRLPHIVNNQSSQEAYDYYSQYNQSSGCLKLLENPISEKEDIYQDYISTLNGTVGYLVSTDAQRYAMAKLLYCFGSNLTRNFLSIVLSQYNVVEEYLSTIESCEGEQHVEVDKLCSKLNQSKLTNEQFHEIRSFITSDEVTLSLMVILGLRLQHYLYKNRLDDAIFRLQVEMITFAQAFLLYFGVGVRKNLFTVKREELDSQSFITHIALPFVDAFKDNCLNYHLINTVRAVQKLNLKKVSYKDLINNSMQIFALGTINIAKCLNKKYFKGLRESMFNLPASAFKSKSVDLSPEIYHKAQAYLHLVQSVSSIDDELFSHIEQEFELISNVYVSFNQLSNNH